MTRILLALAIAISSTLFTSCGRQQADTPSRKFTIDVLNGYSPVKNQGRGGVCWIYAMLATVETEHIMRGDSVNLSPDYIVRQMLCEQYRRRVLTAGAEPIVERGTAPELLRLVAAYGAMPFDSYSRSRKSENPMVDVGILARKTQSIADRAVASGVAPSRLMPLLDTMLDESLGPLPPHVYMLGAEYTPEEFGRSVCREEEYLVLTSFTHHPFGEDIDLELPDNHRHNLFHNVPIDTLVAAVDRAVAGGHGVCWEGDISEPGFSFSRGVAGLDGKADVSQRQRQQQFETRRTTDDHCMSIVGIAHDSSNRRYYIMKNSWGTSNPYHGLVYMSEAYLRLKTIAVVVAKEDEKEEMLAGQEKIK